MRGRIPVVGVAPAVDDAWSATVSADRTGRWSYRVEGWSDPYGTWNHDAVIKVANLDPAYTRDTWIHLTMPELGLAEHDGFVAHDLITGEHWNWGRHNFVRVGPDTEPVHIVHVQQR